MCLNVAREGVWMGCCVDLASLKRCGRYIYLKAIDITPSHKHIAIEITVFYLLIVNDVQNSV